MWAEPEPVVRRSVVGQDIGDLLTRNRVEQIGRAGFEPVVVVCEGPDDAMQCS